MRPVLAAVTITLFLISVSGCAGKPEPVTVSLGPDQSGDSGELIRTNDLPADMSGFILYDPETGTVIQSHNRDVPFIPASVTKILTILAALDILGPDFRFDTFIHAAGDIVQGRLAGDLYLRGTGDPLLAMADLMLLAARLKAAGLREVAGNFYYDETALYRADMIDPSMDEDVSYNPGISALSLEYNTFIARWERDDRDRDSMKITLIPDMPFYGAGIAGESPGKGIPFKLVRSGIRERWLLSPEEKRGGSERLPVHNPGLYTAFMFRKACAMHGVILPEPKAGAVPSGTREVAAHRGRPLSQIAEITLTYSNNIMAELMLLASARKLAGRSLPLAESGEAVAAYVRSRVRGIDWSGFRLENGSGLTSGNSVTPSQMLGALVYADSRTYGERTFISMLPASGWEWSMLSRLYGPNTAFHVWGKTGTINYAIGLSGYIFTSSHRRLLFSFFITDREKRRAFERDPDRRERDVRNRAYWWNERMKDAMDRVLEHWIAVY